MLNETLPLLSEVSRERNFETPIRKAARVVLIHSENCKACGLCIASCPRGVLARGPHLNAMGYEATIRVHDNCSGCGICFYSCPEPGAISIREIL